MEELISFIAENVALLIGLGVAGLLVWVRSLVKKTKNTVDDEAVKLAEENKDRIVEALSILIKNKLIKDEEKKK